MKKKIIFVTKALWIGGIETALINLLNYFDYDKYDVTLLVFHAELDMLNQINKQCHVIILDREKTYTNNEPYKFCWMYHLTETSDNPSFLHKIMMWTVPVIKWIENRLYIRYIRNFMENTHYDTAIVYSDVAAETTLRAILADKYLMFYHHGAMRHVYHDQIAYKRCDKIIAVSENQANELRKFVPESADKIIVIHNLTDVDGIRAKAKFQTEETFDKTKFNIVSVGRVSHEKGMDIAVQVCAKLIADGFKNIQWWIVGDGPAMEEVLNTIKTYHMEEYVITVGMQNNPYPYIRQADLYVQPSRFEGYPMTILEALILGKNVVSTNNNGAKEIIQNGINGLLCEMDVELMMKTIENLLNRAEISDMLSENVKQIDFERLNKSYATMLERYL